MPLQVHHFIVCTNERAPDNPLTSCAPNGGKLVYQAFVREIAMRGNPPGLKVTPSGCLTPCQVGPNVICYPVGVWYAHVTPADVAEIVQTHLAGGTVARLLKPSDIRIW